jgi:hypothetical protein
MPMFVGGAKKVSPLLRHPPASSKLYKLYLTPEAPAARFAHPVRPHFGILQP